MELEGKLETLREYICFLKHLNEEVRLNQRAGGSQERGQGGQAPCGHGESGQRGSLLGWLRFWVIQSLDNQLLKTYYVNR